MEPNQIREAWYSYPGYSDGEPASFFYNHGLVEVGPIQSAPELYAVRVDMAEPGDNGFGSDNEVMWLYNFEDAVCPAAIEMGFFSLGRVRSAGRWELAFYGEAGRNFADVLNASGPIVNDRPIQIVGMHDPEWTYLLDYLSADAERWQWIKNNSVVMQLTDAGDNLDVPRPVDHSVHFESESARVGFIAAAEQAGFTVTSNEDRDADEWWAFIQREDKAHLNEIHEVVLSVIELTQQFGGIYDGWGCPIAA